MSTTPTDRTDTFVVNVEIAILHAGRYLMIVRAEAEDFGAGWLTFPGGKLDWNGPQDDAIRQTAHREAREEVGLALDPDIEIVEMHTFDAGRPCLDIVVLARPREVDPQPVAGSPEEVAAMHWMTRDEIVDDPRTQPWTIASLDQADLVRSRRMW